MKVDDTPVLLLLKESGDDLLAMCGADTCIAALNSYQKDVVPKDAAHSLQHNMTIFTNSIRQLMLCMRALVISVWQRCLVTEDAEEKEGVEAKELRDVQRTLLTSNSGAHNLVVQALSKMETVRPAFGSSVGRANCLTTTILLFRLQGSTGLPKDPELLLLHPQALPGVPRLLGDRPPDSGCRLLPTPQRKGIGAPRAARQRPLLDHDAGPYW